MDINKFLNFIIFVFCFVSIPDALAYDSRYIPFSASALGSKFPLTCVAREVTRIEKFNACGVDGQRGDYTITMQDTDKRARHWKLELFCTQGGSIWKGDLDNNGQPDLILLLWTGGNGIGPNSRLIFLMFDKNHRPNIFSITGYFNDSNNGIEDIRLLPQQNIATLVEQILAHGTPAGKNYWRTTLWQAEYGKWISLKQFSELSLPTYTLFTDKANHRVTKLRRTPEVYDSDKATIQLINTNGKGLEPSTGDKFTITK